MLNDTDALQLVLRAQARRSRVAATLLRLLADYVAQAIDELQSLATTSASPADASYDTFSAADNHKVKDEDSSSSDDDAVAVQRELADVHARVQRIASLLCVLQRWHDANTHGDKDGRHRHDSTTRRRSGSSAMDDTLHALRHMCAQLRGDVAADTSSSSPSSSLLSRIGQPTSLAEASLELHTANVKVLYRRSVSNNNDNNSNSTQDAEATAGGKRARDKQPEHDKDDDDSSSSRCDDASDGALAARVPYALRRLAATQRALRQRVYSARDALLPPRVATAVSHALYVSPAVRHYALANAHAEGQALWQAWCVHTKAHLLRELPRLRDVVHTYRDELHTLLPSQQQQQQGDAKTTTTTSDEGDRGAAVSPLPHVYFVIEACHGGVVRVCVQHGLYVDVTYDLARKTWVLLQMHWNVWTSEGAVAATTLIDESIAAATSERDDNDDDDGNDTTTLPLRRVQPSHGEAMTRYVQRHFADDGFAGGCVAANRLLCCVVLDVVARQLSVLRDEVFVGPLRPLYALDVRAGTYVACRLTVPLSPRTHDTTSASTTTTTTTTATTSAAAASTTSATRTEHVVHMKCSIACGTVAVELRGDDSLSRDADVRVLLSASSSSSRALPHAVVLDMEQLLWRTLLPDMPQP